MGRGPLPCRLGGLEERRELPSGVRRSLGRKRFWRILKATERFFLYLYDKIILRGTICISVPHSKFWGTCPPSRVIYAQDVTLSDL